MRDYRDVNIHHQGHHQQKQQQQQRHHHLQQQQHQSRHMGPAKCLGNLAKGYRHSYAEPIKYCVGRVGLAAIEPY